MTGMIVLVTGGARSGKSRFAEARARQGGEAYLLASGLPLRLRSPYEVAGL